MQRHPRAKRDRILWKKLFFPILIAAACSLVISFFWSANQPISQTMGVTASKPQTLSIIPSPSEITSRPVSSQAEESTLFSTGPNRKRIRIAKAHVLFPENPKENNVKGATESELLPATPTPDITIESQQLHLEIPEQSITPPVDTFQTPQVEVQSRETPDWELHPESFPVPAEFRAKIVKNITPSGQEKVIALTFDDGPSPHNTLPVLDILKQSNIKATFFWIGQNLKAYPKIAEKVVADGHAIGNHTWHHWYHHMDRATAAHEVNDTAELIYKTIGITTSLFRPPGGVMDNGVADYAKTKNYITVMWSIDSLDYRHPPVQQLVNNVVQKTQPGAIVLMHDGGKHSVTVEALPQIIAKLQDLGYTFLTVPELLERRELQQSGDSGNW